MPLNKTSISAFDILLKARHMRMVKDKKEWKLHNTRTKDIELFQAMGFTPSETYVPLIANAAFPDAKRRPFWYRLGGKALVPGKTGRHKDNLTLMMELYGTE